MLNLLVTGTFVIFSSVLTAKYIIGEYKDRTILLMFTYPIKLSLIHIYMFLASAREAASYGANVFMLYTGAPQNTRRKEIFLNILNFY